MNHKNNQASYRHQIRLENCTRYNNSIQKSPFYHVTVIYALSLSFLPCNLAWLHRITVKLALFLPITSCQNQLAGEGINFLRRAKRSFVLLILFEFEWIRLFLPYILNVQCDIWQVKLLCEYKGVLPKVVLQVRQVCILPYDFSFLMLIFK